MSATPDEAAIGAWLIRAREELKVFVDPAHLSYLPIYLGRADALHALGHEAVEVLAELRLAARVYASNMGVMLTKLPREQVRRRRLDPFEVALVAGDALALKSLVKSCGVDPMPLIAGIADDAHDAEISALTPYFTDGVCRDVTQMVGFLAVSAWISYGMVAAEDGEGLSLMRKHAARAYDDYGHLVGGVGSGGVARIRTIHETLAALRPVKSDIAAEGILRHQALAASEREKAWAADPKAGVLALGALDRTALALMAVATALGVDLGPALAARGADGRTREYARALGHSA